MNTEKIKVLLLTIEKGSISAAAESLNYTPSAVSRCIQSLENELSIPLISRSKHGVEITSAGEQLLPDLKRIVQQESFLKEHSMQLTEGSSGTIRLGICYPVFYPWVSSVMAEFNKLYPDVHYIVNNGFSSVLMDQVKRREIDLCIISKRDDSYSWVPLIDDELMAILPANHPHASDDSVPISLYANEAYLELHSYMDTDNTRAFRAEGVVPQSIIHISDSSALYPMVEAGLGIGMENKINTLDRKGNFVTRPLDPPQMIPIGIASRQDVLPVAGRFIDFLSASKSSFLEGYIK